MALTRDFRTRVAARVQRETRYRRALLRRAVQALLDNDLARGKALLRDYINATVGFETLARSLNKHSKSLHRMLGPRGNPCAENIFAIIKVLQELEGTSLRVGSGG